VWLVALLLLAGGVVARGLAAERAPWGNMYEFALTGALAVSIAFAALRRRYGLTFLAVWIAGVVLLTLGLAVAVLYVPVGPLVPALRSYWLVIHVFAAIVSASVFTVAMAASTLQIVKERAERLGRTGGYTASLPSSGRLDEIAYRMTAFGFPVWTFAVVAGAIWAEASWGRYWGWDPKEVWALVTWLAYAGYLHARTTAGWRGRRASTVALIAYASLLFNFFGVNIFFAGLHSYGGV
jgi:cytochrome c-type biogenesis protein CcsB